MIMIICFFDCSNCVIFGVKYYEYGYLVVEGYGEGVFFFLY